MTSHNVWDGVKRFNRGGVAGEILLDSVGMKCRMYSVWFRRFGIDVRLEMFVRPQHSTKSTSDQRFAGTSIGDFRRRRRQLGMAVWAAAMCVTGTSVTAQSPTPTVTSQDPLVAESTSAAVSASPPSAATQADAYIAALPSTGGPTGSSSPTTTGPLPQSPPPSIGVTLNPPLATQSLLPRDAAAIGPADAADAEIARMPWLLRKLTGDDADSAIKMDPPKPPTDLAVPPSLSTLPPRPARTVPSNNDGWVSSVRPPLRDLKGSIRRDEAQRKVPTQSSPVAPPQSRGQTPIAVGTSTPRLDPRATSSTEAKEVRRRKVDQEPEPSMSLTDPAMPQTAASPTLVENAMPAEKTAPAKKTTLNDQIDQLQRVQSGRPRLRLLQKNVRAKPMIDANEPSKDVAADRSSLPAGSDITASNRAPNSLPRGRAGDLPLRSDPVLSTTRDAGSSASVTRPNPTSDLALRQTLDYTGVASEAIRLTRSTGRLRYSIRNVLQHFHRNPEIAVRRSNWGMMHAMMVYGIDTRVIVGRKSFSTIAWIAGNNACRGQRLFERDQHGIAMKNGAGLQGHQAQWLAVLSLCEVPRDYPIYVDGEAFSVDDIVRREMLDCKSGEELTFTLIALSHYLDTDETWLARDGERWSLERLIREELSQPIVGAACGGTHRLMGFAHALRNRRLDRKPIDGQWARAKTFTDDFTTYAYRLQNRDGSMSTDWFEGREDNGDDDRKVQTTGHIVEWLLTVTPDEQLQNPRLVSAINYLTRTIGGDLRHDWSIGPKGHALRSLAMFYERVYKTGTAWQNTSVASRQQRHR